MLSLKVLFLPDVNFKMRRPLMSEDKVISLLRNGDRETLRRLYESYRNEFTGFAGKFGVSATDSEDIYQDAIIVTYEKARSGQLESLDCSLKTYLFSVGKYMMLNHRRSQQRTLRAMRDYEYDEADYDLMEKVMNREPVSEYQQKLLENFKRLGETCRRMLDLFYRHGLTLDQIMETMGYDNKNVVKSQKSRCLKTLREYVKES